MGVRVRFAPSPTGFLHIGSLRTVLFDYLIAKSLGGKLILRIEDTDQARKVEGSEEKLIDVLNWIGITFDEGPHIGGGYGPYIQTERQAIYDKHIKELLEKGEAYYCFCSSERLQKLREDQQAQKLPPRYDRKCINLSKEEIEEKIKNGESYVIRQKMPISGEVKVQDELRGEIVFKAEELEDHVLIKSNGIPTYQFASVVDDHLMEISHVVRGEEWIPSFPKNIALYRSFGWEPPKFIHIPLTLNKGGGKLSKRQGDVAVEDYKAKGYTKEALINFCALLGWSPYSKNPNIESEVMSMDELIKNFNYKDMGISPAVFDTDKLDYLNGFYIRQMPIDKLVEECRPYLKEVLENTKKSEDFLKKVIKIEQERLKKLSDIKEATKFFFAEELDFAVDLLVWKKLTIEDVKDNLKKLLDFLEGLNNSEWTEQDLNDNVIKFIKDNNYKVGDFLWPMRVSLSGEKASPGPFEIASILGRKESLKRIKDAINKTN